MLGPRFRRPAARRAGEEDQRCLRPTAATHTS
jgi:hypothetical protein